MQPVNRKLNIAHALPANPASSRRWQTAAASQALRSFRKAFPGHPLRRAASVGAACLFTAWMILGCQPLVAQVAGADKPANDPSAIRAQPNIIWIVADDLGYNDLSCMGQQNFKTPHLDQMASEGMRFTQFYAGCTVCAPSRACFLTGNHTGHVYQRFNGKVQFREDPADTCIASVLRKSGYHTAMIGKSGLACNSDDGELANRKGFDYFFGYSAHAAAHRYYPQQLWRNGQRIEYPNNRGKEGTQYSGDLFLDESLQWIREHRQGPFFLHLALQQPHADLQVPSAYRDKFIGQFDEKPFAGGHYRAEPDPKATFVGMVTYLDASVGKLLDELRELDIADQTLVLFTSDNGPHFEGGHHPDHFDSNGPLRGGKRDMFEGGIRVPLIAWWPGTIQAGQVSPHIAAFWDLTATACEMAGTQMPQPIDGISMLPTLTGEGEQLQHEYLYWEFYEQGGKQALRRNQWKAIRLNVNRDRNGKLLLFDLEKDLGESTDIADQHPEVVAELARLMDEAHTPSEIVRFGPRPQRQSRQPIGKRVEEGQRLDRQGWKIVNVDSESTHNGKRIGNILDDQPETIWHTQWKDARDPHPHQFVIDLGQAERISGFRILNRQDGSTNGFVAQYQLYVYDGPEAPTDPDQYGEPVQAGRLPAQRDEIRVQFQPVQGRFVRWVSIAAHNDQPFASIAEFNLETPEE